MRFDIYNVIPEMLSVLGNYGGNAKKLSTVTEKFLKLRADRIDFIGELRLAGEISRHEFYEKIQFEKTLLATEINALEVLTEDQCRQVARTIFDVMCEVVESRETQVQRVTANVR